MGLRLFDNPVHLVLLLVVILIVFGAGKLPGVGSALGQSIKEFKKAATEPEDHSKASAADAQDSCQNCNAKVPAGAQFCPACGTAARPQVAAASAVASSSATIFCSQCGAKNVADARFCAQCGTNMSVHAG
ncbi:MAG TPA: twin-arginine translocase TatA/TatE family subunit [Dehalococcoidia bacterium]|nr:twin-arginine translocase TatA/TatE family subunit [Dehalococcoidia bacterium]